MGNDTLNSKLIYFFAISGVIAILFSKIWFSESEAKFIINIEYDIIKDPLLYITVDYDPNCNIIKTNYDQIELIFSNLELTLSSNITTEQTEQHIIYLDLLPPVENAIWSSNTTPLVITTDEPFSATLIELHLTDYDYNNYNIFTNECKSRLVEDVAGITTYDIDVYIGFYKTEDIKSIIIEKTNE